VLLALNVVPTCLVRREVIVMATDWHDDTAALPGRYVPTFQVNLLRPLSRQIKFFYTVFVMKM